MLLKEKVRATTVNTGYSGKEQFMNWATLTRVAIMLAKCYHHLVKGR